jgi:hypothetical protein
MSTDEDETGSSDGRSEPLGRNPDADPVRIHREYVQQRLGGGALPTPQAYERALDQWHRLPGAMRGPATELHPVADEEFAAAVESESYEGPLPATDPGDNRPYERRRQ